MTTVNFISQFGSRAPRLLALQEYRHELGRPAWPLSKQAHWLLYRTREAPWSPGIAIIQGVLGQSYFLQQAIKKSGTKFSINWQIPMPMIGNFLHFYRVFFGHRDREKRVVRRYNLAPHRY